MQTDDATPEQARRSWWLAITVTIVLGLLFLPLFWIAFWLASFFMVDVIWIKFVVRPQVILVDPKEEQQKQQEKVQW